MYLLKCFAFAYSYANSEILREPAVKPIEERIPPDLLWLFRGSWQSTLAPFGEMAKNTMNIAMKKSAERYTELIIAVLNRCFASDRADIHYSSILDVADLISLEQ